VRKKKEDCVEIYNREVNDEFNAFLATSQVYFQSKTEANCKVFKTSAQAYISALEQFRSCSSLTGQGRIDFEASLMRAKNDLNALTC